MKNFYKVLACIFAALFLNACGGESTVGSNADNMSATVGTSRPSEEPALSFAVSDLQAEEFSYSNDSKDGVVKINLTSTSTQPYVVGLALAGNGGTLRIDRGDARSTITLYQDDDTFLASKEAHESGEISFPVQKNYAYFHVSIVSEDVYDDCTRIIYGEPHPEDNVDYEILEEKVTKCQKNEIDQTLSISYKWYCVARTTAPLLYNRGVINLY